MLILKCYGNISLENDSNGLGEILGHSREGEQNVIGQALGKRKW